MRCDSKPKTSFQKYRPKRVVLVSMFVILFYNTKKLDAKEAVLPFKLELEDGGFKLPIVPITRSYA